MYTSASSVCSVNHQARILCPQRASKEANRFLAGTCSLHEENEIHVLEYYEDSNQIESVAVYSHGDRLVCGMDSSPYDPSLIATCGQKKNGICSTSVWKMANQSFDMNSHTQASSYGQRMELEEVAQFSQADNCVHSIAWQKLKDNIMLTSSTSVSSWLFSESGIKMSHKFTVEDGLDVSNETNWCPGVSTWDPHSQSASVSAFNTSIHVVDWRRSEISMTIPNAHGATIRDIDYNPNKPKTIITAGDDRTVKFWDLRNPKLPLKTLHGHSHWVYSAKYNPFHDQLIVSGGSDNIVNLWRIASCSSSPLLDDPESSDSNDDPIDVKVKTIDQHEDSIYGLAWSPADAWIYVSLSFDGRIVANHVPSTEKYKILL